MSLLQTSCKNLDAKKSLLCTAKIATYYIWQSN